MSPIDQHLKHGMIYVCKFDIMEYNIFIVFDYVLHIS